jgi:hypothetical protein
MRGCGSRQRTTAARVARLEGFARCQRRWPESAVGGSPAHCRRAFTPKALPNKAQGRRYSGAPWVASGIHAARTPKGLPTVGGDAAATLTGLQTACGGRFPRVRRRTGDPGLCSVTPSA